MAQLSIDPVSSHPGICGHTAHYSLEPPGTRVTRLGWARRAMRDVRRVIGDRQRPGHDKWMEHRAGLMWHTGGQASNTVIVRNCVYRLFVIWEYSVLYWDCCMIEWLSVVCNICMNEQERDHCKHSLWPHTRLRLMSDGPMGDKWLCSRCPHHITDCVILKFQNIPHHRSWERAGSVTISLWLRGIFSDDEWWPGLRRLRGHWSLVSIIRCHQGRPGANRGLLCDQWHWHDRGLGSLIT